MRLRSALAVLTIVACSLAFPAGAGAFQFLSEFGSSGAAAGQLDFPEGVGVGPNGHVYVGEYDGDRVDEFTSTGTFVRMWGWGVQDGGASFQICTSGCEAGTGGSGDGQFNSIGDLDVHPVSGDVYALEDSGNRIQQFAADGSFIRKWGSAGDAEGQFSNPYGFDVGESMIVVADPNNDRLQEFTSDGTFVRMFGWGVQDGTAAFQVCTTGCQAGISGAGVGQLAGPNEAAVASNGDVYVADGSERIQQFTGTGSFIREFGGSGSAEGKVSGVQGLANDAAGNLWAMDSNNNRLQEFTSDGSFVRMFGWGVQDGTVAFQTCITGCQAGISGGGAGQFSSGGYSITFDCRGNLYATDGSPNDRIQKLGEPGAGEPPCASSNPPTPPGSGATPAADKTAPKQTVKAAKKQKLALKISVTLDEPGTVTLTGSVNVPGASKKIKFKPVSKNAGAGQTVTFKPKLSKKNAKSVKKALKRKKKLTAKFKLKAIDTAGNASDSSVSVKLKR